MTSSVVDIAAFDTVIGIPTFRRPELLQALLESLLPELRTRAALVIVADNDCGEDAQRVVEAFRASWPHSVCIGVTARGVAQVRNALVRQAHLELPQWRWLVMLDDDGVVTSGWLERLIQTGERYDADMACGPVEGALPSGSNLLARNSIFAARRRYQTGPVPTLNGTQGLAIARKALDLTPEPLFRNEYGASGGEDYDLFRRMARAGGRMVWCEEAVVLEPAPAGALTVRNLLNRYATTGAYMVIIDRSYDGARRVWTLALRGMVGSSARLLLAAVTLRRNKFARALLEVCHYGGRLAGLLGMRSSRYVSTVKNAK